MPEAAKPAHFGSGTASPNIHRVEPLFLSQHLLLHTYRDRPRLTKPFKPQDIEQHVRMLCGKHPERNGMSSS
jgi:hypothetical protein